MFSLTAFSEGTAGSGHGSVTDLKWNFLNFLILFGFAFVKFRKPLSKLYEEKAVSLKKNYLNAEEANKQADLKLKMFEDKSANLESLKDAILKSSEERFEDFKLSCMDESCNRIRGMEREAEEKLTQEKHKMEHELSAEIVDLVISNTSSRIKNSNETKTAAASKMLSNI